MFENWKNTHTHTLTLKVTTTRRTPTIDLRCTRLKSATSDARQTTLIRTTLLDFRSSFESRSRFLESIFAHLPTTVRHSPAAYVFALLFVVCSITKPTSTARSQLGRRSRRNTYVAIPSRRSRIRMIRYPVVNVKTEKWGNCRVGVGPLFVVVSLAAIGSRLAPIANRLCSHTVLQFGFGSITLTGI